MNGMDIGLERQAQAVDPVHERTSLIVVSNEQRLTVDQFVGPEGDGRSGVDLFVEGLPL